MRTTNQKEQNQCRRTDCSRGYWVEWGGGGGLMLFTGQILTRSAIVNIILLDTNGSIELKKIPIETHNGTITMPIFV